MNRPRWINKRDFLGWLKIMKYMDKDSFYSEFISDYDSEEQKKQAQYIYNNWDEIKSDDNEQ